MGDQRILAVTTMRNEGPFVLEWVAHHLALGVSRFLVFTNDCDDGTDVLLDALAGLGVVDHVRQDGVKGSVQWQALKAAKDHSSYADADWVSVMDCDELISLRSDLAGIPEMIAATEDPDAILMPWRFFGHSGHLRYEDAPVTERFRMAAPLDLMFPAAARFFKTLYRPNGPFSRPGVHRPKTRSKFLETIRWVGPSGHALPEDFARDDEKILTPILPQKDDIVRLNHYSLRSLEDFMVKRARGLPNRKSKPLDATYWAERNFNVVEDARIERHSAGTRAKLDELLGHAKVRAAHDGCVERHRAKIVELLADPEERHMFSRLALLQGSDVPSPETAKSLLRLIHTGAW